MHPVVAKFTFLKYDIDQDDTDPPDCLPELGKVSIRRLLAESHVVFNTPDKLADTDQAIRVQDDVVCWEVSNVFGPPDECLTGGALVLGRVLQLAEETEAVGRERWPTEHSL